MMIGLVQPGTSRGTFLQMIGSRKITPPRMLRMVPFGDFHISFRPNSFTRASSGVMVAHLTPTPTFLVALAASTVTWSLVLSRCSIPRSKYIRLISRHGVINLSLMYCQMIRVISSPSSSTTGLVTLIFAMIGKASWEQRVFRRDEAGYPRYSTASALAEATWLCSSSPSFSLRRGLRHAFGLQHRRRCRLSGRGFGRKSKIESNPVILLEKSLRTGNRDEAGRAVLNRFLHKPVQRLELESESCTK